MFSFLTFQIWLFPQNSDFFSLKNVTIFLKILTFFSQLIHTFDIFTFFLKNLTFSPNFFLKILTFFPKFFSFFKNIFLLEIWLVSLILTFSPFVHKNSDFPLKIHIFPLKIRLFFSEFIHTFYTFYKPVQYYKGLF